MADLTIRGVSDELHAWLKQQARTHHRSVNREAIALIEAVRAGAGPAKPRPSPQEILSRARRFAELRALDTRPADEILGYDDNGLPGQ
jgi:antitoxin VapB